MNRVILVLAMLCVTRLSGAQNQQALSTATTKKFPEPDFVLVDKGPKPSTSGVILGPMESDGKGGTKGSFAVNRGSSLIQVASLSLSGDGRILAVGSTPGRVDLWDVDNRKKLLSIQGGAMVGISPDGRVLAEDGNGIQLRDVATGKPGMRIPWIYATSTPGLEYTINNLVFNPSGTLLNVTANGKDDSVYDVASGKLVATLTNTQHAQFSQDGALLI